MGVTIRDVAREAGVSPATVSRVFNDSDLVNVVTRDHILAVARRLQYVPNASARSLTIRRSRVLGLILPLPYSEFFAELINGMDEAAIAADYNLMISTSHNDLDATLTGVHMMRGHVDAYLVVSPNIHLDLLKDAIPSETPAVFLHSPSPNPWHYSVGIDNTQGALEATRHLLECGFRRIAIIRGPLANLEVREREAGYRQALEEWGIPFDPDLRFDGTFTYESGVEAARQVLTRGSLPDAIFAFNDHMAIGVMHTLSGAGIRVPNDIAVMGFDNIPSSRFLPTPLSTVDVPEREMGRGAVKFLLEAIEHRKGYAPRARILKTKIVPRASTLGSRYTGDPGEQPDALSKVGAAGRHAPSH